MSASYFQVLGVSPALGLNFDSSDDRVNGPNLVIISEGLWQRRFNGEGTIVGRQVTLNSSNFTVIGVMPRAFENVLAPKVEVWSLLQYDASLPSFEGREWGHHLRMVGRLPSGVGIEQMLQRVEGDWTVEVVARVSDFDEFRTKLGVPVD